MYTLILIVSFIANGAAVDIDHIPFNNEEACRTALAEILRDTDSGHDMVNRNINDGSLAVKGYCVSNNIK